MRADPLSRIAGEGGARRERDRRVRVRLWFRVISTFLTLTPTLSRVAGEGGFLIPPDLPRL
jgi:hypothetical protein